MDPRTHRRDFVRTLTLGASASALASAATRADEPDKPRTNNAGEVPANSEADARMEIVLARFGKQLDENARKAVRSEIQGIVRRAEALRKFKLENGDGPWPVFHPYRAPLA